MYVPKLSPIIAVNVAYIKYLSCIINLLYPSAFNVPIFILSSSIVLVMVVIVTSVATIKNITGNTFPIIPILSKSLLSAVNASLSVIPIIVQFFSNASNSNLAFSILLFASFISSIALFFSSSNVFWFSNSSLLLFEILFN